MATILASIMLLGSTINAAPIFKEPEHVKGIYLSGWTASSSNLDKLIKLANTTEINSFVIDIKDNSGLTYKTMTPNITKVMQKLHDNNIYPIARIVVFYDPILVKNSTNLAVIDSRTGKAFKDGGRVGWISPYKLQAWEYSIQIAKEAIALGFTEIQWDYVRFPDVKNSQAAFVRYPGNNGDTRATTINKFLRYARDSLGPEITMTADVFGLVTTVKGDLHIGQQWEDVLNVVDAIHPMVYPSHYARGEYGIAYPNAVPYKIVHRALSDAVKRSKGQEHKIRPWLQAFTLGKPPYTEYEIRQQIKAANDLGINEYLLWSPSNKYAISR
jgi:hypothetical protein